MVSTTLVASILALAVQTATASFEPPQPDQAYPSGPSAKASKKSRAVRVVEGHRIELASPAGEHKEVTVHVDGQKDGNVIVRRIGPGGGGGPGEMGQMRMRFHPEGGAHGGAEGGGEKEIIIKRITPGAHGGHGEDMKFDGEIEMQIEVEGEDGPRKRTMRFSPQGGHMQIPPQARMHMQEMMRKHHGEMKESSGGEQFFEFRADGPSRGGPGPGVWSQRRGPGGPGGPGGQGGPGMGGPGGPQRQAGPGAGRGGRGGRVGPGGQGGPGGPGGPGARGGRGNQGQMFFVPRGPGGRGPAGPGAFGPGNGMRRGGGGGGMMGGPGQPHIIILDSRDSEGGPRFRGPGGRDQDRGPAKGNKNKQKRKSKGGAGDGDMEKIHEHLMNQLHQSGKEGEGKMEFHIIKPAPDAPPPPPPPPAGDGKPNGV